MKHVVPQEEFKQRRHALLKSLPPRSVALVAAHHEVTRSNDTEFPFRQNSDFFYLTGFNEPDAVLLLINDSAPRSVLFCHDKDPSHEVWHGLRLGYQNAVNQLGVDTGEALASYQERLPELLQGAESIFYPMDSDGELADGIMDVRQELQASARRSGKAAPQHVSDLRPVLDELRLIKSEREIDVMTEAARISSQAFRRIMRFVEAGRHEYQVAAELQHEFAMNGALHPAYGIICGGGANACVLHYTDNKDTLCDGDLLLVDAGGEYQGYAADITRTFPVNGKFSEPQAILYNLVLQAQYAALNKVTPGGDLVQASEAAARVINDGLTELGILTGNADDNFNEQRWKTYFIHGLGHWLGLDVHDVGTYRNSDGTPRAFEPGMVLTVEPGIYIPNDADVDPQWRGIGIRIEDDVVVTEEGHHNLTGDVPKTIDEIEAWMTAQ